jgi:type III restriction enzyme
MPRKRPEQETPPADWVPTQAVENPVINNPYTEPNRYWLYKGGIPSVVEARRPARYYFKTQRVGAAAGEMELFKEENEEDLPLVNALRADVKRWRESGYRGGEGTTKELLRWWTRPDRPRRLFFCQQEAVETIIYLLELALPGRLRATGFQKFEVDAKNFDLLMAGQKPTFAEFTGDIFPRLIDPPADTNMLPLRRMGCKMATGSGKTIVMGMLITWAFCNRARNPSSTHFPNAVLICAPNLTVKKRLQVLRLEDPDNYYDAFDLVPPKFRECLNMGKVLVTNWHFLAPKSEKTEGGKSWAVVDKGEEPNDAFTKDRLGELAARLPILVLNDEGHHCWRGRPLAKDEERAILKNLTKEQKEALEEEAAEARVWLTGLDRINNSGLLGIGADSKLRPAILACVDLSATPFYLGNSGYPEGSPFPWLINDFGLVDAIECGIVKVPRMPVKDDADRKDEVGRPDPKYFRLWHYITERELQPGDYIRRGQPKPDSIYKYAEPALAMLAGQWKIQFNKYREDAAGKPFVPPVMIIVCDNTELSEVFHRNISGEREVETVDEKGNTIKVKRFDGIAVLPELANSENVQHTIRIDTRLLAQIETEEGESRNDAALRLREVIDTVGKRGGMGEQVRCIVSVAMLTEGWDANNVTHALGVRAFGSQLLCEQVVGRGLRRMSYRPDPETGLLQPEYVDVYGIPFSLIPFKGKPKSKDPVPDPVYRDVYAMPERMDFEIRMPNVESYVYSLREGGIRCDVEKLEGFIVDQEPDAIYLAPTRGYYDESQGRRDIGDFVRVTREEYYKSIRRQQLIFRLAQFVVDDLIQGAQAEESKRGRMKLLARHHLFPEVVKIVQSYIERKVILKPGVDVREIGLQRYAQVLRERIRDGILPAAARDDAKLLPILNSFEPFTTTANVNYSTTRPVLELVKSHLNRAVIRSNWEQQAIEKLEELDCVECFTPNDRQIGLVVPYDYADIRHSYEPDFIVRLRDSTLLMLEIKGPGGRIYGEDEVLAKNAAAKKWISAVNNHGRYGRWEFELCEDLSQLREILERHAGDKVGGCPFRFVEPTPETMWRTCVPLTTLQAMANKFCQEQFSLDRAGEWFTEWITWDDLPKLEPGMFVARVYGKSMEPYIPDGSYCVFRQPGPGSRQGRTLLVWHSGVTDPHTGGQYTVRVYEQQRLGVGEVDWRYLRIRLHPRNPKYETITLEPQKEDDVRVIAEFVQVVGGKTT